MIHCAAKITIADEFDDNHREFCCQNWPNHKGRHNWSGKQPLTVVQQLQGAEPLVFSLTWHQKEAADATDRR